MKLFNVYPILDIELNKSKGIYVFDVNGNKYLDFYGGHAVISIGHSHPYYIKLLKNQLDKIPYYSNSVFISQKEKFSCLLGEISGYKNYYLFICNSGTESNENAIKIASIHTGKKKLIAFNGSFHGRTSGSASVTDNYKVVSPFDTQHETIFIDYEDINILEKKLKNENICAVITEGLQGISGIIDPGLNFFLKVRKLCSQYNVVLIVDEVQSGYGRTGLFFSHQYYSIKPDLITVAKGMGNGFPIGGVLIHPKFKSYYGMLGSTFGGNYLSCLAGISVLEIMKNENLIENAKNMGKILLKEILNITDVIEFRGKGLMIGLKFSFPVRKLINYLIYKEHVFVGSSNNPYIIRLLPPLNINENHIELFLNKLKKSLMNIRNIK
ncbi:aspartate aminotransferase family protein [Blattabacterium cuenoti]|uniref:aspartate aminotransferase family protein n=1 Tax=Blattabacterium cuenoti TaxID=1653831 RepID=UPI00163CD25A|nr:aminotransferase class III-fold pyridoxal phosphate-dependent enzyme [Blattabacterium cuenoti]